MSRGQGTWLYLYCVLYINTHATDDSRKNTTIDQGRTLITSANYKHLDAVKTSNLFLQSFSLPAVVQSCLESPQVHDSASFSSFVTKNRSIFA